MWTAQEDAHLRWEVLNIALDCGCDEKQVVRRLRHLILDQ